ncbi:MAG TPA: hypothetical protein VNY30_07360 [Bryobacteraceae bacterium]|jgi:hypothetical protein|nr:hypothetical protein [Bryobacteraceae bacterium]
MLHAELHGHASRDIATNEDYLTSAVFGHLRYVRPVPFWRDLFSRAIGIGYKVQECSLLDRLPDWGAQMEQYSSLEVFFWPSHPSLGTPDLCLCFAGAGVRPLVIVVEAKLWSGKSGSGESDQLLRYLRLLADLEAVDLPMSVAERNWSAKALLYVTAQDSKADLLETAALCDSTTDYAHLLFRAQWQDITAATLSASRQTSGIERLVLEDVGGFLRRRNLEYFAGFRQLPLPLILPLEGFYDCRGMFTGFAIYPLPVDLIADRFCGLPSSFSGVTRYPLPSFESHFGRFYSISGRRRH